MKIGNYDELLNKFYAGTASVREISLLQSEALISREDILYAKTLKEEREQKMDWEFEDFMNEIPSEKVIAFPNRSVWLKRMLSAAAVVLVIITAYIFWLQSTPSIMANLTTSNKPIDSSKEHIATAILPLKEIKDTTGAREKAVSKSKDYAMNTSKKRAAKKSLTPADKTDVGNDTAIQDYLVIVNGKPVTNEADAIAITRESLGMISRHLTLTVDELKPVSRIKIKL